MRAEHERLKYKIPGIEFWEGLYQKYSSAERRRLYATDYEQLLEGSRLTRDGHDQASELPAMYASKERLAGQIDRLSEKIAAQVWPRLKAMSPFEVLMNAPDSNYDEILSTLFICVLVITSLRERVCDHVIMNTQVSGPVMPHARPAYALWGPVSLVKEPYIPDSFKLYLFK